ncbi:MAG: hypothetical protein AAFV53_02175, partial [Myxococcota bacterium]
DLRRRFYEENGYAQSVDRSGRSIWLSPAEQELRESGRKKRRKKRSSCSAGDSQMDRPLRSTLWA